MKNILFLLIVLFVLCNFAKNEVAAQKKLKTRTVEPQKQIICSGSPVPKGFVIVEQTTTVECITANQTGHAYIIEKKTSLSAVKDTVVGNSVSTLQASPCNSNKINKGTDSDLNQEQPSRPQKILPRIGTPEYYASVTTSGWSGLIYFKVNEDYVSGLSINLQRISLGETNFDKNKVKLTLIHTGKFNSNPDEAVFIADGKTYTFSVIGSLTSSRFYSHTKEGRNICVEEKRYSFFGSFGDLNEIFSSNEIELRLLNNNNTISPLLKPFPDALKRLKPYLNAWK